MIDLEKLRAVAQSANTAEQWYAAHDMTSCSYDYDKAFIAACSPSVVLELLDHLAQLEKDAGRIEAFAKAGAAEDCAESDAFYEAMDGFRERENDECPASYMRAMIDAGISAKQKAIDTAMESNHG